MIIRARVGGQGATRRLSPRPAAPLTLAGHSSAPPLRIEVFGAPEARLNRYDRVLVQLDGSRLQLHVFAQALA